MHLYPQAHCSHYSHWLDIPIPNSNHLLHNILQANAFYCSWTMQRNQALPKCLHIRGATQKFPKFLCHSLTTYRNFYSPPSPSKKSPSAVIQSSQQDFHDWKHYWKSFHVSIFITSCESVWIPSMSSQQNTAWQSGSQWVQLTINSSAQLYYKQFLHSIPTSGTLG